MVAVETLLANDVGAFENGEGEARKFDMNSVRGEACGSADLVTASELNVRSTSVPIVLSVVQHHGDILGHCMIDAVDAAISGRVVGSFGKFVEA